MLVIVILLCPSSGVSVWRHFRDLMGFGKQRISTIRSRTQKRKLNLKCEYEMIWDAEGSVHLVVGINSVC